MKSVFTLILVFILISGNLFAKKVDIADAKKAANTFVQNLNNIAKQPSDLSLVYTSNGLASPFETNDKNATAYYYVFNFEGSDGYIIISADDAVTPILAYSTQKKYRLDNQPEPFIKWMDKYRQEIQEIISKQMIAGKDIENQWTQLKAGLPLSSDKNTEIVNPLLQTTWDQMDYYHDLCPYDASVGRRVPTGCVATAMAQIMKYHNHPQNGEGYHSYNHDSYGTLSADFGSTTYNWSAMPNNVTSTNNAVATLMYHCGVGLEMGYGPNSSGTRSVDVVATALKEYFSYSSSTQFTLRESYNDNSWNNLLKEELNNSRPIEYAGIGQGGGHAFVCDGYDANSLYHFNWGWSGYYDGYFNINNLNPGTGGTGAGASNYNEYQQIVYGIQPETGSGGGGGGGGGTSPGEGSPLTLYSSISISPNPIDFYSAFSVNVDIANASGASFTGDLTAAIFNSEGVNVGFVETKTNATLENNYYYTLSFATDGMPVTPGSYTIGLYSKISGGEWIAIKDGEFNNNVSIIINGPQNDIALYSVMNINPNPIIKGEEVTIDVNIANYGAGFSGKISADLYTAQGEYEALISELDITMEAGYWYSNTFTSNNVDVEPGTYIIALWNKPVGGEWSLMGSSNDYPNPITIKIVAPELQEDPYENNDTEANAYVFSTSNGAHTYTTGSNSHTGEDFDYYQFNLDANYKYEITARVHDAYNSGNGQTYTNDVIFSYNQGNGAGEGYDDVLPSAILVNGKSSIKFYVAPYFVGQKGTYLLDVNIVKKGPAGINDIDASQWISMYPNPAKDNIHIEFSDVFRYDLSQGNVYNAYGQLVYSVNNDDLSQESFDIDVSQLESGAYFLRLEYGEGQIIRKFNVLK
jgi:hypothetical protein